MNLRSAIYVFIVCIGLIQIVGHLIQSKNIKGLGAAFASSPLPIVFTEVRGVETYANDFYLVYTDENGQKQEQILGPEMYAKLKGPYNRRNVYGAAISYGPILPEPLWSSVLDYAFCEQKLASEMGMSPNIKNVSIRIETKTQGRNNEWILAPKCNDANTEQTKVRQ